jgi:hypothetical protein
MRCSTNEESGHDYISEKQAGRAWLFFAIFASLLLSFDYDPAGLVAIKTGVRFLSYFSRFRHCAFSYFFPSWNFAIFECRPSASLFSLRDIHWIWRDIYLGQMWIPPQSYDAI